MEKLKQNRMFGLRIGYENETFDSLIVERSWVSRIDAKITKRIVEEGGKHTMGET